MRRSRPVAWLILILTAASTGAEPKRPANRLARETSPYLRLHAHNPVDWFPWGPEAFAKAKAENKPIFLSIGYSSCYWKHDWRFLRSFRGQPCVPSWVEVDACINPEKRGSEGAAAVRSPLAMAARARRMTEKGDPCLEGGNSVETNLG
jgi:hypothetical protein